MSKIKYFIGWLCSEVIAGEAYYRIEKYKRVINGDGYRLNAQVCVNHPENVFIGNGTYINGGEICASENAKIIIGENCLISYNVFLRTDSHNYLNKKVLINQQGSNEKDIVIGNDVWIGYDVKIMSGVKIANGCVIASGAVVTKDTEPYCLYAGIPAKKIKERIEL